MNCASRILAHLGDRADHPAIWTMRDGTVDFRTFGRLAGQAQALSRQEGLAAGDAVLVLAAPGATLFAAVVGLLGRGVTVVFVEPWLPVRDVEHVLRLVQPKAFIGSRLAQLWAGRVPAARRIPRWIHLDRIRHRPGRSGELAGRFAAEELDPETPAIITFTSGTTGPPKGIVRTHRYMWDLHEVLMGASALGRHGSASPRELAGPDLCIFPNLALLHLGSGRGAVLVPPSWSDRALRRIAALPAEQRPETLTCGPAFLARLSRFAERCSGYETLRSVFVGGAQSDCAVLDRAFERWPDAEFTHVYGGTEAEPVALAEARDAVRRSRARGGFQTLFVGRPIPELRTRVDDHGLWVSGPNVATPFDPQLLKDGRLDRPADGGSPWHCMGDRLVGDADGLWFAGRMAQPHGNFELEQRVYAFLGTSACFIHQSSDGRRLLLGEQLRRRVQAVGAAFPRIFPEIDAVHNLRIIRDRRHRARIDRTRSLARGGRYAA